jgi:hypothetical protein
MPSKALEDEDFKNRLNNEEFIFQINYSEVNFLKILFCQLCEADYEKIIIIDIII